MCIQICDLPNQVPRCTHFLLPGKGRQEARHLGWLSIWHGATHYLWVQDKNLWRRESKPQYSWNLDKYWVTFSLFSPPLSSLILNLLIFCSWPSAWAAKKTRHPGEQGIQICGCTACDLCLEGFKRNTYLLYEWGILGKGAAGCSEQHISSWFLCHCSSVFPSCSGIINPTCFEWCECAWLCKVT